MHTPAMAAGVAKNIVHIKQTLGDTPALRNVAVAPPNVTLSYPYPNPNETRSGLPPKSNGFFRGPCTSFPPNFVKIT